MNDPQHVNAKVIGAKDVGAKVIYCTPRRQFWTEVVLNHTATVRDAILSSRLLPAAISKDLDLLDVCIAGVPASLASPLARGATIEIYDRSRLDTSCALNC